jgi:integral membrane protein (TIGR00529 family)
MPALVKILAIFTLIVVLNRARVDLGLAVLLGTLILGAWFGLGLAATVREMLLSFTAPMTLTLLLLVTLILVMNQLMDQAGQQKRMVESFAAMVKKAWLLLAGLPALIGLLPMPGGAYFSAPMVDAVSGPLGLSPEKKTAANYWFRHIWEFWWPIYPGVILAVSLSGLTVAEFVLVQLPYTPVALLAGILVLGVKRKADTPAQSRPAGIGRTFRHFVSDAMPILIILCCTLLFSTFRALFVREGGSGAAKYFPIFSGLIAANVWVIYANRLRPANWIKALLNKKILQLALLVLSVMAYKQILNLSGAILALNRELNALQIPVSVVVMFLPFISGMVMGIAVGFVGSAFPVVISLVAGDPHYTAYISLAYGFGFAGMMLSPVHICLVLTRDYFHARFSGVYRFLVPMGAATAVFTVAYFILLHFI